MRRREKFIVSAILLSLGLLILQYVSLQLRILGAFIFFIFSYLVSAWALFDDLNGVEWFTVIPLPAIYALSVSLFYFLLPESWLSRILIMVMFGVGIYALYLTCNIYSVSKNRSIQLLRAAHTIGLLFTLLTSTLLANTIFSFHFPFWLNGLLLFVVHFPLFIMSLWSVHLQSNLSKQVKVLSFSFSLLIAEVGMLLSLMPLSVWTSALLITSLMYITVSILQNHLQERLFKNTLWEYLIFGSFVMISFLFLVGWK